MNVYINRPWISSFSFSEAALSESKLDQVHKLSRNLIASLNLGNPSVRHVGQYQGGVNLSGMDQRAAYLEWVRVWKIVYAEVSTLIRLMKAYRRTARFTPLTGTQLVIFKRLNPKTNLTSEDYLRTMSANHLDRLSETAMVLLNARFNAKLAAAEARRRALAA